MLTGVTVMGQAGKCRELEDYLRVRGILQRLGQPTAPIGMAQPDRDLAGEIEKLGRLRDQGYVSDAEFEAKKAELLCRM
jgi:hypothetical protein